MPPARIGEMLEELLLFCAEDGARNRRETLLNYAKKHTTE